MAGEGLAAGRPGSEVSATSATRFATSATSFVTSATISRVARQGGAAFFFPRPKIVTPPRQRLPVMRYPIELRFKLITFGQRISATDADGKVLMFVSQRMFKLKEQVEIYRDTQRTQVIFRIAADRVLDWSASYHFTDAAGNDWGSVRRKGMKSLWSAHYDVIQDGQIDMTIEEESPMKKLVESMLGEIPVIGILFDYLLNPSYLVRRPDGTLLLKLIKKPAFLEGKFTLEKLTDMPEDDELRSLLALIMVVLLERRRG